MTLENEARSLPRQIWWGVLLLIVLVAAALRLTGYNFSLPYVDHPDEPVYMLAARMVIDQGSPKPLGMQGYPPGIIAVNYVLLRFFQDPTLPPTSLLFATRLLAIGFSLLTIVTIALLARQASSSLAGLIAALIWAVAPQIVEYSRYATADSFVTFFALLSLYLVLNGTRTNRQGQIYAGTISLMFAIIFKYQAIVLLPLILFLPLTRLRDAKLNRAAIRDQFGRAAALIGAFGFWLLILFPALEAGQSPYWSASAFRLGLPTPQVLWNNLLMITQPVLRSPLWAIAVIGFVVLLWPPVRSLVRWLDVGVIALALIMWLGAGSFYGNLDSSEFRQFITVAALSVILVGVGVSLVCNAVWLLVKRIDTRLPRVAVSMTAFVLVLIISISDLQMSVANAQARALPDQRNLLTQWADVALPPGGYVAQNENHKVFNSDWGGFFGIHRYPLIEMAGLTARPVDEWRSLGAEYAIIRYEEYPQLSAAVSAQLLPLRTFPPDSALTGPAMVVARLTPMQRTRHEALGMVTLVGYDIGEEIVRGGDTIQLTHYWQAAQPLRGNYHVFNHLLDADGSLVAQADGHPTFDVRRSTQDWRYPNEILLGQPFSLTLPDDLVPGQYDLTSGFYNTETGERIQGESGDSILITQITIR